MSEVHFAPLAPEHHAAVLSLNSASVSVLSPLEAAALARLIDMCSFAKVILEGGICCGFILALESGSPYASENYRWFCRHRESFLYVDRIVIGKAWRGRGLGNRAYDLAIEFAAGRGLGEVVCEIDIEPPNPASLRFHQQLGFVEVGRQSLSSGKSVSLQARAIELDRSSPIA